MTFWWKLAILGALLSFFGMGIWEARGWKDGVFDAKITEAQQTNTINAENKVITTERTETQTSNEVSNAYEKSLSTINSVYAPGMLNDNTTGNSMPKISDTALGHNGPACADGLSFSRKTAISALIKQADTNTAKLLACQLWIKKESQIGEKQ